MTTSDRADADRPGSPDDLRRYALHTVAFPLAHLDRLVKARGHLADLERLAHGALCLPVGPGGVFPVAPSGTASLMAPSGAGFPAAPSGATFPPAPSGAGQRLAGRPMDGFDPVRDLLIGAVDGQVWFARVADAVDHAAGLRDARLGMGDREVAQASVAMVNWHRGEPLCDHCHRPTVPVPGGGSRVCDQGHENYPRTDPAVIMALTDPDDRLLLAHQGAWDQGRCSVLAGFVEAGESAESAVAREVAEEVSLHVAGVRWLGSQPWPFPRSLMLGFQADATGDPVPDGEEIGWARWFSRPDLGAAVSRESVTLPPPTSIAGRMIRAWRAGDL